MNGSVRELRPGYWQMRVYIGRDPQTKKDRYATRAVRASSKREAARHLPAFIVELHTSTEPTATRGTVAHLIDTVLTHLRDNLDREPKTMHGYTSIAGLVKQRLGNQTLGTLTPQDLNRYYTWLRTTPATNSKRPRTAGTVNNHHRFIHRTLALAVRWGWITANVADRADPPPVYRDQIEPPTNDMVAALIAAARAEHESYAVALILLAGLGCRPGELCGLRWSDIDLDAGTVRIRRAVKGLPKAFGGVQVADTKTHGARRLTVGPGLVIVLNGHHATMVERAKWADTILSDDGYVLSDEPDGSLPWNPARLSKMFTRVRTRVGFTGRLYDLRHWNTSELLDAGEDVTVVAGRQGHSEAMSLNVYGHMRPSGDQRAAAIIDGALFGSDELAKKRRKKGA